MTTIVNGLSSANGCSQPGIESTGTNADEANVSGKITMKPRRLRGLGDDAVSPTKAKTHEKA